MRRETSTGIIGDQTETFIVASTIVLQRLHLGEVDLKSYLL